MRSDHRALSEEQQLRLAEVLRLWGHHLDLRPALRRAAAGERRPGDEVILPYCAALLGAADLGPSSDTVTQPMRANSAPGLRGS
jgi:hypothetical protein